MIVGIDKKHDVAIVKLTGSLDVSLQKKFKDKLIEVAETEELDIVLDFEKVTFIDSSCLGSLVSFAKSLRERNGDIKLANPSPDVRSIFQITRLDRVFEIYNSNDEALNSFFR